jgi:hypothetical protein
MIFEILAVAGGFGMVGLLIAFLWARAGKASAQKKAAEQEQFAESLKAGLAENQRARTESEQRYEDLARYYEAKLKEASDALGACAHDPAAVRVVLRDVFSLPASAPSSSRGGGGPVPPPAATK